MRSARVLAVVAACWLAAAACTVPGIEVPFPQGAADTPTPSVVAPTPPPPPKALVVCLAEEPNTLYLYGSPNAAAQMLMPALYDGPFDVLGYEYRPVILESTPSVEAGSVRLEPVSVASGGLYFNPTTMLPEQLKPGKPYLPSGCTSADCQRKFEGGSAQLDRMVVEFTLLPDLQWSDGSPLTAKDSVFSYRLDSDPSTPSLKDQVHRTAAYEAVDDRTVRWTGIPGYFDSEFGADFWTPLPEHVLGRIAPGDLPQDESASRAPIGWGPYLLQSWLPGESMSFVPNPRYRRPIGQGHPFDLLQVRFLAERGESAVQQVLTGECDVLDEALVDESMTATLKELSQQGRLQWLSTADPVMERLDFDTAPLDDRPPMLKSVDVRRALAACIDRQGLIDQLVAGLSPVPTGMVPKGHPLASTASTVTYDPAAAREALTGLGWIDDDGDPATPRTARGVSSVPDGTPLRLSLLTTSDDRQTAVAAAIVKDLAACGAQVESQAVTAETLYDTWPDGPVFGRKFDLVAWPWLAWVTSDCEVFTTSEVASSRNPQGSNASGFSDAAYDAACAQFRLGPIAGSDYPPAAAQMQAILDEAVPSLPLLQWPRMLVASPRVCGVKIDPTAGSLLWNLEDLSPGPACPP